MTSIDGPLAVLNSVRPSLAGQRIIDIGCGTGALASQLLAQGADVTGIDPDVRAIRKAIGSAPQARFVEGVAEKLPYDSARFDVAILVNSLHHVPEAAMSVALREAIRVLAPGGALIVIEPLATGNFFEALRMVEDETIERRAAQAAIALAIARNDAVLVKTMSYIRRDIFDAAEQFLERITAVDPRRREVVERNRPTITDAVVLAAERDGTGRLILSQPIRANILTPA